MIGKLSWDDDDDDFGNIFIPGGLGLLWIFAPSLEKEKGLPE